MKWEKGIVRLNSVQFWTYLVLSTLKVQLHVKNKPDIQVIKISSQEDRDVDRVLPLKSNWKQTRLGNHCTLVTNELVITGPLFPHKIIHKVTWISPDGRTRNQIDHVLINKRFRNSVEDTRVYRSADLGSDHYLVCKAKENRASQIRHIKAEKWRYPERIQD